MKRWKVCIAAGVICMLMPVLGEAYLHETPAPDKIARPPSRVIVKLLPECPVLFSYGKSGTAKTGIPGFDQVNDRHQIRHQEPLFPKNVAQNRPDYMKNVLVVSVPDGVDPMAVIRDYQKLDYVEYAELDQQAELYGLPPGPPQRIPNDILYRYQWSLNNGGQLYYHVERRDGPYNDTLIVMSGTPDADIDADEVYKNPPDETTTAVVAILDTGADLDHPDLAANIWTNPNEIPDNEIDDDHNGYIDDIHGWDFGGDYEDTALNYIPFPEDNDPTDEHGHGTHCAGIAAAVTNNMEGIAGINLDAKIMVLDFDPFLMVSYIARAAVYAADNGADAISMSFGLPFRSVVIEDALEYARSKGVVLCAAAGNSGNEDMVYPAILPGVITVSASDSDDRITEWSSYGDDVDLCAPGQSILSLRADSTDMYSSYYEPDVHIINDIYYLASGTSMSSPAVAGIAAFLKAVSPGITPDEVLNVLAASADDLVDPYGNGGNFPGWDKYSGYGRINLNQTLQNAPGLRADITAPVPNLVVTGAVDIMGTADGADFSSYVLEYGESYSPSNWMVIESSSTPVTDGLLGTWNTIGLDGPHTIRLRLGSTHIAYVSVYVANACQAEIDCPVENDTIIGWQSVLGTASCPEFSHYLLEFGEGASPTMWTELHSSSVPVINNELGLWSTDTLAEGSYTLKLSVFSGGGLEATDIVLVYIQQLFSSGYAWIVPMDDEMSPVTNFGDFDDDGNYEIVFGTANGLRFYNPDGTQKFSNVPTLNGFDCRVPVAVGYLDHDGVDDFVALVRDGAGNAQIFVSKSDEGDLWIDPPGTFSYTAYNYGLESKFPLAFLLDIDGDGNDEIHYGDGHHNGYDNDLNYYVYNADGTLRLQLPKPPHHHSGYYICLPADLDGDYIHEYYIVGRGMLYQIDALGTYVDSLDLEAGYGSNFFPVNMSSQDIDDDDLAELIVFGRFEEDLTTDYWTYVIDDDFTVQSGWPQDSKINHFNLASHPVFADIDGDGDLEYFIAWWDFELTRVYAWHLDGTPVAGTYDFPVLAQTPRPSTMFSPIMADMDGDFHPDIVGCARPDALLSWDYERLVAWDRFGDVLNGWPIYTVPFRDWSLGPSFRTPTVGDIDRDGYIDLIHASASDSLVFINYEFLGGTYDPRTIIVPTWRLNRSFNNNVPATWTCGDVNADKTVDSLDIDYLVDFLYCNGPAPRPMQSADANGDCDVNLLDVSYLNNYLNGGGPDPLCDCDTLSFKPGPDPGVASAHITSTYCTGKTTITINTACELSGLEIQCEGKLDPVLKSWPDGLRLVCSTEGKGSLAALIDTRGRGCIGSGTSVVLESNGQINIIAAVGCDRVGNSIPVAVTAGKIEPDLPREYALRQNNPNPFNPTTGIMFTLPNSGHVALDVFNIMGQKVVTLADDWYPAGEHTVVWDGTDKYGASVATGVYFYRLSTDEYSQTRKMVLLK